MGKGLKWIATFMVAWILVLGVMVGKVEAAGNNVHGPSGSGYEYICIENHESNPVISTYLKAGTGYTSMGIAEQNMSGFSYDLATNTITMTNVNMPLAVLNINEFGDDLKICVVGDNALGEILVWGYGYGGSLEITGSGSLTLTPAGGRYFNNGILLMAEGSASVLKVAKTVTFKASGYTSPDGVDIYPAIEVVESLSKNSIIFESADASKLPIYIEKAGALQDGTVVYNALVDLAQMQVNATTDTSCKWGNAKVTKKATTKANGVITYTCSDCGKTKKQTIYKIAKVKLSKTSYVYNGKARKPGVTLTDSKGKKIDKKYYTVSYKKNVKVGTASVVIKLKGNYSGTITKKFKIKKK
ncbi:MAG: hypothetical protein Q4D51_11035 [Eubacteriales bacterium]|nr:hypothetical protein [Eubacteriales bacterium]